MPRDMQELDEWIEQHPHLAWMYTVGIGLWIALVGGILDQLVQLPH